MILGGAMQSIAPLSFAGRHDNPSSVDAVPMAVTHQAFHA